MDLGCYCVHAARMLLGEPERCTPNDSSGKRVSMLLFRPDTVPWWGGGSIRLLVRRPPPSQELEVVGSDGFIRVFSPFRTDLAPTGLELVRDATKECVNFEETDAYAMELRYFVDMVQRNDFLEHVAGDSISQARAVGALYRSASLRASVTL